MGIFGYRSATTPVVIGPAKNDISPVASLSVWSPVVVVAIMRAESALHSPLVPSLRAGRPKNTAAASAITASRVRLCLFMGWTQQGGVGLARRWLNGGPRPP